MLGNSIDAAEDMAKALKAIFKKYTLTSRKRAWNAISTSQGKKEIDKLVLHFDKPTSPIRNLRFAEWLRYRKV